MKKKYKILLYCTKAKPYLVEEYGFNGIDNQGIYYKCFPRKGIDFPILNGKIVAEIEIEFIERIEFKHYIEDYLGEDGKYYQTDTLDQDSLCELSCLSDGVIDDYFNQKDGYAIHLKNVKSLDKPRELNYYELKKAPQNMCYACDKNGNLVVIISIRSVYLCKIMNGKKTIEIRKSILNVLKE